MDTIGLTKKKRIKTIVIFIAVCVCAAILSATLFTLIPPLSRTASLNSYYDVSEKDTDALFRISDNNDLMFDKKAYLTFEKNGLGNTNNNLIASGGYAQKNNIICQSLDRTYVTVKGEKSVVTNSTSSYINIIGNDIYYRDNSDRKLYKYSLDTKKSDCVVDANCGEIIATAKGIYYIDYSSKTLFYKGYKSKAKEQSDLLVDSYAVVGNSVYVLTHKQSFGLLNSECSFTEILSGVDSFFVEGAVYIQKGTDIYKLTSLSSYEKVKSVSQKAVMIYQLNESFYFLKGQEIIQISEDKHNKQKSIIKINDAEFYKSIYETEDSFEVTTVEKKETDFTEHYQSIKK